MSSSFERVAKKTNFIQSGFSPVFENGKMSPPEWIFGGQGIY